MRPCAGARGHDFLKLRLPAHDRALFHDRLAVLVRAHPHMFRAVLHIHKQRFAVFVRLPFHRHGPVTYDEPVRDGAQGIDEVEAERRIFNVGFQAAVGAYCNGVRGVDVADLLPCFADVIAVARVRQDRAVAINNITIDGIGVGSVLCCKAHL